MNTNITEIAKKAKVSISTVSRALNQDTRNKVAPGTLKKIDLLVKKYNYTPHLAAKNLRKSPQKIIGIIFPYVENIFYSSYYNHILAGVANYLLNTDYQFKMLLLKNEKGKFDNYNFQIGEGISGLIMTQWFRYFSKKEVFSAMSVPSVIINDYEEGIKANFICLDNAQGGYIAAEHFYSKGHRHFGIITGPAWSRDSKERLEGFFKFCHSRNGNASVEQGDFDDHQVTIDAFKKLVKENPRITAIFCCNDNMAFMIIEHFRQVGIPCPAQISVIGFDDDFRAAGFMPALTTLRMPVYDMAQQAAKSLIECLEQKSCPNPMQNKIIYIPQLIERQTVIDI